MSFEDEFSKNLSKAISMGIFDKEYRFSIFEFSRMYQCDKNNVDNDNRVTKGLKMRKIYDYVFGLCQMSWTISDLKGRFEQKKRNNTKLNYELNSINNNINNIQSMVTAKYSLIANKNNDIISINNLADSLVSNFNSINERFEAEIANEKIQIQDVINNIKEKENFVEQIKNLEKDKKEDLENMKKNNKNMKEKNNLLISILTNLESKLI